MRLRVLCVVCACVVKCFALDREAFTFTSYDLKARVEPEQHRLGVRGKITLRNDSASAQKKAVLQISSTLSWRSIQVQGKALQFVTQPYQSDIDHTGALSEAIITLPGEISPGDTIELQIGYEGTIPLDTTRLKRIGAPKEIAVQTDWDQMSPAFTAVRGVGYVVWYPVALEAASLSDDESVFEALGRWRTREQLAEMKVTLSYTPESAETPPLLFCNGEGGGVLIEAGGGKLPATDCSFQPLGWAVPTFLMDKYEMVGRPTVKVYYLPGHKAGADNFGLAADLVVPFITEWFGEPREKVVVVELASSQASTYENGRMLLTSLQESNSKLVQVTVAHQLAHAAFFSPREWIYEGLAHFAQALYRERQDGRQAALDYLALHEEPLRDAEQEIAKTASAAAAGVNASATHQPLLTTFDEVFYGIKAPYVWWMLRDMVGDAALKKALAEYHPSQDKEPSYMQHLIEAQAKRDLGWFLDDWVYNDRGLPDFRVASVYSRKNAKGENYLVTITLENMGNAGAEVPVTLRTEGSELLRRVEVRRKATATVRIEAYSLPLEVIVNDGSVPEMDLGNNTYKITGTGK